MGPQSTQNFYETKKLEKKLLFLSRVRRIMMVFASFMFFMSVIFAALAIVFESAYLWLVGAGFLLLGGAALYIASFVAKMIVKTLSKMR